MVTARRGLRPLYQPGGMLRLVPGGGVEFCTPCPTISPPDCFSSLYATTT